MRGHTRDPGHHCCTPPGRSGHHCCATLTPVSPLPPDNPPDPTLQYPTKRIAPWERPRALERFPFAVRGVPARAVCSGSFTAARALRPPRRGNPEPLIFCSLPCTYYVQTTLVKPAGCVGRTTHRLDKFVSQISDTPLRPLLPTGRTQLYWCTDLYGRHRPAAGRCVLKIDPCRQHVYVQCLRCCGTVY